MDYHSKPNKAVDWFIAFLSLDCPTIVGIMISNYPPQIGSEATCDADAHPPATFRWMTTGSAGTVSGSRNRTLTVTSLTDEVVHFRCTAVNFLHQTNEEACFSSASIFLLRRGDHYEVIDGQLQGTSFIFLLRIYTA